MMTMTEPHPSSTTDLLQHAGFVRAVARAAVRGDHDVDDVVQETWLSSLQVEPDQLRRPRGWLGAVVHRRAADEARSAGRRRARERRVARDESLEPTVDVVARAEIAQRLAQAVLSLDEPYRTAILMRYFDDLPPREIAAQTGVPVETVRTRVKRGLERLRQTLDDGEGGNRSAWVSALVPLLPPGTIPAGEVASGGVVVAKKWLGGAIPLVAGYLYLVMTEISSPGSGGWYGLASIGGLLVAVGLIVADLIRGRGRRKWATGLLGAAFLYLAVNIGMLVATFRADPFAIFEPLYLIAVVLVLPAVGLGTLLVVGRRSRRISWLGGMGIALWIVSVSFAHLWAVAQASASV